MRIEIVKHAVLFVRAPPTWGANNKIIQLTKTIPMKNNHAFRDGQNLSMKTCKEGRRTGPVKSMEFKIVLRFIKFHFSVNGLIKYQKTNQAMILLRDEK
uniref:Uncharacterized protein n=1 Tax=Candidatus Kentrum sp. TUN TaxID=2126343 RepID=A0A450ZVF3_9GAMM|nr:MAG: hypothetical protein BECKTUN1418D_GA0071000_10698 [Candidatus Kentron sp. TUN]